MSDTLKPHCYGVQIGDAWVSIDFEAQAMSITKDRTPGCSVRTDDLGNGFLIDYNADGNVIAVEVIAGRSTTQ